MAKSIQARAAPPATVLPEKLSTAKKPASASAEGSGAPAAASSILSATRTSPGRPSIQAGGRASMAASAKGPPSDAPEAKTM